MWRDRLRQEEATVPEDEMKLNDRQLTKVIDEINADLQRHSEEFARRFMREQMSQVRCIASDQCPNKHTCRHVQQHSKDERFHNGSRPVGCSCKGALCMPVPKGDKCIVKGCPNHKGEGGFVGDMCGPCHTMLTTGAIGSGETFVHKLQGRKPIPEIVIQKVMQSVHRSLQKAIAEKGDEAFASALEMRGAIDEEVEELHDAVHANDKAAMRSEAMDVVIAGIWGLASMEVCQ